MHVVLYTLIEQFFLTALSLTFRGYEAGLFYAYCVISSSGLCFSRYFLTGFDHKYSVPLNQLLNDFLHLCFKPSAFLFQLNNLNFFGFLRNAWT